MLKFSEILNFLAKIPEFWKNSDRTLIWIVRMVRSPSPIEPDSAKAGSGGSRGSRGSRGSGAESGKPQGRMRCCPSLADVRFRVLTETRPSSVPYHDCFSITRYSFCEHSRWFCRAHKPQLVIVLIRFRRSNSTSSLKRRACSEPFCVQYKRNDELPKSRLKIWRRSRSVVSGNQNMHVCSKVRYTLSLRQNVVEVRLYVKRFVFLKSVVAGVFSSWSSANRWAWRWA